MKNLNQEILGYVSSKSGQWSDSTISTVYSKLSTINHLGFQPDILYQKLTTDGYSRYTMKMYFTLAQQYETEVRGTTIFKSWLEKNHRYFKNCYKKKNRAITTEQFEKFLALANSDDLYNFLVLIGKAGLRCSEALSVNWENIKESSLEVNGKGDKQRFIPFNISWLKGTPRKLGPVLLYGLKYRGFFKTNCEGFTPHDFRAYYATKIVNMPGMSIEDARDLLGHNDIKTTAKYLRADKERRMKLIMENFK